MPSYKLTYYNGRGLGELVRLTFVAAGVTYEDKRVNKTEWEKLKDGEYISIYLWDKFSKCVLAVKTTRKISSNRDL